jgi:aryl-alcohol dehydrogenase-like predicted oxidoreductase
VATRALGETGIRIFPVGLGTVKLGRNTDVKYPQAFDLPSDEEVTRLLEGALASGVNLLDTAPAYGRSESRLGPFVEEHRERLVICTKAGESYEHGVSRFDFSADAIVASAEASLARLQTDVIDLLLLHSDGEDVRILRETDALEGLQRLRQSGKARAIGISAKTAGGIRLAAEELDVIMAPYSLSHPELGEELAVAHAKGRGILAIKTLASGHLASGERSRQTSEDALRHVLRQPFVDGLVLGTLRLAHLRQAVEVARAQDPSASS